MKLKEMEQASYEIYKIIKSTEDTEAKKALNYAFNLIEHEMPRQPKVIKELVPSLVYGGEVRTYFKCPDCNEELEIEEERCSNCHQIIDWDE